MFHTCRITVIKRMHNKDICEEYLTRPEHMELCNKVEVGQSFEIENPYEMPAGLCASAWADIRPYIITIATGGVFPFMKNENSTIVSCTDLFRPVIFEIERI
ncbi:MAG: TIGR04076 family protein [Desulfobacterales bacterium]|nr:TIGR04076 family protein [Desulfobacterales bacterium]